MICDTLKITACGIAPLLPIEPQINGENAVLDRRFEAGDRVRVRPLSSVLAGALGRVTQTLISAQDLCFVLFDGYVHWRLMCTSELEPVTDDEADEDAD